MPKAALFIRPWHSTVEIFRATNDTPEKSIKGHSKVRHGSTIQGIETERNVQQETIDKLFRKLHKQRKIAATQQEILEHLVKENKRHFELMESSRESLNSTNQTLSTAQDDHENEVLRLQASIKRLKDSRDAAKAVADQQAIDLEAIRQRLHVLEDRDLGTEDDVQRRASRLRNQNSGGE
ncbi:1c2b088c-f131-46a4-8f5f-ac34fabe7514 [Sclerotinia trifoliorum]|uniref:1c2b088c-f131-46a4-8f5f-ac34fabe7514 n=1 Tax=Sclerotinia trifoliorum TaxID=28548 RepID=A0A8H2W673_9HELO|nr:1c2b088c-f131-46a4-8f5f-ac34fabe7514 [Sclerotinia trifoliorum]